MSKFDPQRVLTPADVAEYLGISKKAARQLMHELPHMNVSWNIDSPRKRLRIAEQTLNDYLDGKIERDPTYDKED